MSVLLKNSKLMFEEVKAVKFFLWVFYILLVVYDYFYYFVYPYQTGDAAGFPEGGMGFLLHILLFSLLPLAIYLLKKGKPEPIKYIYLISYISLDFINNIMIFWDVAEDFYGGHLLEIYSILFSPIFVNKRFFWVTSFGFFVKYVLFGLLFWSPTVIFPLVLIIFISLISYVLLSAFTSYIKAMTAVHEDLRQTEKLAVIGQMATAIGHEIKNPLSSLKGFIQLEKEKHQDDHRYFDIMLNEVDRINSIASDLLYLGKPKTNVMTQVDLREQINYAVSILKQQADKNGVTIRFSNGSEVPKIQCDENQVKQVFINLIKNAIEAMPDGGTITISIHHDREYVKVSIEDEGIGMTESDLIRLGEPFYTRKENGTGLGLMVTKKILDEHEGQLNVSSEIGRGTKVKVIFKVKI